MHISSGIDTGVIYNILSESRHISAAKKTKKEKKVLDFKRAHNAQPFENGKYNFRNYKGFLLKFGLEWA